MTDIGLGKGDQGCAWILQDWETFKNYIFITNNEFDDFFFKTEFWRESFLSIIDDENIEIET